MELKTDYDAMYVASPSSDYFVITRSNYHFLQRNEVLKSAIRSTSLVASQCSSKAIVAHTIGVDAPKDIPLIFTLILPSCDEDRVMLTMMGYQPFK